MASCKTTLFFSHLILLGLLGKKVRQQVTNLHQKYTLRSVQWGYANVNLMKAILGEA
jgi:hypothetical protein